MKFVVDESVSYAVVERLRELGHEVLAVSEAPFSGIEDEKVYQFAVEQKAILITRDPHFTNSLRFPPENTNGIVYIRSGNLRAEEEVSLITRFLLVPELSACKRRAKNVPGWRSKSVPLR